MEEGERGGVIVYIGVIWHVLLGYGECNNI